MATNLRSARAVEKYRLSQIMVALNVYATILAAFSWLLRGTPQGDDLKRIVNEYPALIQPFRRESYRLAVLFYEGYREAELGNGSGDIDFGPDYSNDILEDINDATIDSSIPKIFDASTKTSDILADSNFHFMDEKELDELFAGFLVDEGISEESDGGIDSGKGFFIPDFPEEISQEQINKQLLATIEDDLVNDRGEEALKKIAGQSVRNSLKAGRDSVLGSSNSDVAVKGWMRVSDGDPCHFCALLMSRGAVYESKESGGGLNEYHDNCCCSVVPVYSHSVARSPEADYFYKIYLKSTKGLSGNDAINAFRKALALETKETSNPQEG